MARSYVMAVSMDKRSKNAALVQGLLTKHGCIISARLGLHEAVGESCSDEGLIILYIKGSETEEKALESDFVSIDGVRVRSMEI